MKQKSHMVTEYMTKNKKTIWIVRQDISHLFAAPRAKLCLRAEQSYCVICRAWEKAMSVRESVN